MFVIDASVVLAWSFPDEQSDLADRAVQRSLSEGAIAPAHWPLEVAQAYLTAFRRGRIVRDDATDLRELIQSLPVDLVSIDVEGAFALFDLGESLGVTVYDAAYLELARSRGLALATVDARLAAACRNAGVPLIE